MTEREIESDKCSVSERERVIGRGTEREDRDNKRVRKSKAGETVNVRIFSASDIVNIFVNII